MHGPVLLHVGYAKTATTFLQKRIFSGTNGDLELAAGVGVAALNKVLGLFEQSDDVDNALVVAFAGFRQRQLACGPLEQWRAEAFLKEADALGDDRWR